jgi:hypothetical protein
MINYIPNQSTGWKSTLKELQDLRGSFRTHEHIMTAYERETIWGEIKRKTESVAGMILQGALQEHAAAIARYEAAEGKQGQAKAAELRRWNPAQLRDELANARTLAELAVEAGSNPLGGKSPADGIRAIYSEAKQSGDMYKIRAAAEVLKVITPKITDPTSRAAVASMAAEARRDLDTLRQTLEMDAAKIGQAEALANLLIVTAGLPAIGAAIGEPAGDIFDTGALTKAMHKVRLNADHTTAEILGDDDPEITGIDLSGLIAGG